jgi:aspartate carbamoyltransferase catalytic subunit
MKKIRHLIDVSDLTIEEVDSLIACAEDIMANRAKYAHACEGKKIATLFFEPSTRTRMSFEAAMLELGGTVIGFASASNSSTTKGESVMDTIRTVGAYADIIAMRHPLEGAALAASERSIVPVVNAGDGGHCHPTQTLADLLTIKHCFGRLDNLTVGICGDLKYGRTVHSLITALSRYQNNRFVMISPPELGIPNYMKYEVLYPRHTEWSTCLTIEDCIGQLDVLYMTRIQRERFAELDEYERLKDFYILNAEKMKSAKSGMAVLHPLPRVKEINVDVDDDPRACYFRQVENGKFMREALIIKLLEDAKNGYAPEIKKDIVSKDFVCTNPKCVTAVEKDLKQKFTLRDAAHGIYRCEYCETKQVEKRD